MILNLTKKQVKLLDKIMWNLTSLDIEQRFPKEKDAQETIKRIGLKIALNAKKAKIVL